MRIDGPAAMIALEREASLRVEPGARVEIVCLSGVVWITQQGDLRDLFLTSGESLELLPRGRTLVTALEPALVRLVDAGPAPRLAAFARALQCVVDPVKSTDHGRDRTARSRGGVDTR